MSHFICPSCTTHHAIFGSSSHFDSACAELEVDVLARVPLDPLASSRGDTGSPVVLSPSSGAGAGEAFLQLGEKVEVKLAI